MTSTIQSLCISIPETLLHVTLKRRAEISADIFARLLRYFFLSCKNLTIKLDTVSVIYRTENGLVPDKVKTWFPKCSSVHSYNTRAAAEGNFVIPKMRTEKSKQAFIVSGAKLWNEIPDSVKRSQSIESFQEKYKKYLLEYFFFF